MPGGTALDAKTAFARLKMELEGPPYHALLQPVPISVEPDEGRVTVKLAWRDDFMRAAGEREYHGGVLSSLIDLAAHAVVAVHIGRQAPTIDLRVDFLCRASGEDLLAEAILLRAGRSVARADVTLRTVTAKLVAVGRATFSTRQAGE